MSDHLYVFLHALAGWCVLAVLALWITADGNARPWDGAIGVLFGLIGLTLGFDVGFRRRFGQGWFA